MVEQEQVKPLSPLADRTSSDGALTALHLKKITPRKRRIRCCGCITVVILILLATAIVTLTFTVFRVKNPVIKLNSVTITQLQLINNTIPKPGTNVSAIADVSVKNPSIISFKYNDNTTSQLYYQGVLVGEARGPPGKSRARRTLRMNVTVDIVADKLVGNPKLLSEVRRGLLTMGSYSKIPGRVKFLSIKKHVTVKMNCSITVNITTQSIVSQKCKRKVDL